jgi:hypothetical protein
MVLIAGWSSPVARQAHNLKAAGSNPAPATKFKKDISGLDPSGKSLCGLLKTRYKSSRENAARSDKKDFIFFIFTSSGS